MLDHEDDDLRGCTIHTSRIRSVDRSRSPLAARRHSPASVRGSNGLVAPAKGTRDESANWKTQKVHFLSSDASRVRGLVKGPGFRANCHVDVSPFVLGRRPCNCRPRGNNGPFDYSSGCQNSQGLPLQTKGHQMSGFFALHVGCRQGYTI